MENWRDYQRVLLPNIPDFHKIEVYEAHDGYKALRAAITEEKWTPKTVVDEVKKANIRGRGGAGFNAGLKWSFMPPKKEGVPRYLACNGDESEPGTCKDRRIFEYNPHAIIEGAIIACYAMEMDAAYIYIRGEYGDWIDMMQKALDDTYAKGYAGKNIFGSNISIDVYLHRGAGAYICGEETSLMESLEGKRPYPRSKPPFPAQFGLWGKPTTINNVETLSHVPMVMRNGADWYLSIGAATNPGPVLYGISGHVNRPGLYEYPSGMLITDLIYKVAGGIRGGKKIKAVVPGGSSVPILTAEMIEGVKMDADSLRAAGSMLGTAGMCVLDEDTDMVKFLLRVAKFYDHESCGQCTPCREGTGWFVKVLKKIDAGQGTTRDLDLLLELCDTMEGRTVCALADAAAWPVRNTVKRFRAEFEARVRPELVAIG
ncbi:MAG: NADH oxidoreductase (quinone) subunit F [Bacteroidetes bacterium]|nr:MAG: NADH oxidoreductase (quinone) subunit F [Bacteroidota bacterium]